MFTDAWFTGSLKVTISTMFLGTPDALAPGTVAVTTGPASAVVNDHVSAWARPLPPRSVTPVVSRAVYVVPKARAALGVNVAVVPEVVTLPATAAPPAGVRVKVDVVSEVAATASENVAVTVVFLATLLAPAAGVVAVTVGAVRS